MNIKIEKSEFVTIEGLTEAAVASSDIQLIEIVNYAGLASSYLPEEAWNDDAPMNPILQVREACIGELMRRHGDDFDLDMATESMHDEFPIRIKAVA